MDAKTDIESRHIHALPLHSAQIEPGADTVKPAKHATASSASSHDEKVNYQTSDKDLDAASKEPYVDQDLQDYYVGSKNPITQRWHDITSSKGMVVFRDMFLICLLLGWWIPGVVRQETRHKWIITTIWTWFFILLILFHNSKYIPQAPFVRVLSGGWNTLLGKPWSKIPYVGKLVAGWGALIVLIFGSTYGLAETANSSYVDRTIALAGIFLINAGLFACSHRHSAVKANTTILGLGFQFIIGLFVFKTGAGLSLFTWIATAAADFLGQGESGGATFFWSADFVANHYFFVNVLSVIIFFVAFTMLLVYTGTLQWVIKKFAWFFFKTMGISGAEAIVAVASPFIGQGENCVLTRPYVGHFTASEFHQVLVSGFATIAGSVFLAYVSLGVPPRYLITSSVMSIPGSILASKLRMPETRKPLTAGNVAAIDRGDSEEEKPANALHAYSLGAWFGLRVAGLIFCNVLVIVSLLYVVNGLLTWIGYFWGIGHYAPNANGALQLTDGLTLQLIFGYVLYPFVFMLGMPRGEVLQASRLLATKIVANEFVAYLDLQSITAGETPGIAPFSDRGRTIVSFMLCGFGNISSMGINIGIMSALAPKRSALIVKLAPSALITGILVTCQAAAIAGILSD